MSALICVALLTVCVCSIVSQSTTAAIWQGSIRHTQTDAQRQSTACSPVGQYPVTGIPTLMAHTKHGLAVRAVLLYTFVRVNIETIPKIIH